jgi:tetratricopeptide (TPR) repeat protein
MTDNQWDKALEYTIMGRDLAMELGNPYSLSKTYANLSVCYQTVRKYDLALENMLKGLELVREFGDDQFTARMLLGTAVVNRFLKRYPLSIAYLDTALFYAERIQSTENLYEIYGEYYNVYGLMGNTDSAMAYVGKFIQLKDTLYSMENRRLVAEMQEAYEMEKKDREIVILNQEKELKQKELNRQKILRNGLTGGLAVVFLFAGVFLFQRNRIAREKKYSDNLLLNILPAETAQELKTKGYADAKSYDEVTDVH